ncbi:hypothetical protein DH2020_043969 [Rehmannia glutinosa]|uniref:NADP-dependent oxidoreductase domain-containing protein n=1 Tax=Rehmannia glutinosa TaxID=99300 RepID=A0ABR0UIC6_REHGL
MIPISLVSKLGYGCMGLTGPYNAPVSLEDGITILKEAFKQGITFFDTADIYGIDSANEYLVGKVLKQLPREEIQVATKFGFYALKRPDIIIKGSPDYARSCCEASLKRLQVDYIDLYYIHRIDTTVPIEETMEELKKLVEEGKIRYIGLSEASADTIRRAHAVHPITALQMEYSLWTRDIEQEIIPLCRKLGIGIVSYSPVGRGFLLARKLWKTYLRIVTCPSQLALSWVLHQGADVVPIPGEIVVYLLILSGTTKIKNLHDNIGSVNVNLTSDDLEELCEAVPIQEVAGKTMMRCFTRSHGDLLTPHNQKPKCSWRKSPPSKTTAGILLPEKSSKLNSGKVVAVGPGTRDKAGNSIPVAVKEGDTVLLPEYGGTQVKLGEKEYHLYRDEDILGTLHD